MTPEILIFAFDRTLLYRGTFLFTYEVIAVDKSVLLGPVAMDEDSPRQIGAPACCAREMSASAFCRRMHQSQRDCLPVRAASMWALDPAAVRHPLLDGGMAAWMMSAWSFRRGSASSPQLQVCQYWGLAIGAVPSLTCACISHKCFWGGALEQSAW